MLRSGCEEETDVNKMGENVKNGSYERNLSGDNEGISCSSSVILTDRMSQAVSDNNAAINCDSGLNFNRPFEDGEKALPTADDLVKFSDQFKKRRIALGLSQSDVGSAIGSKFHREFSQTTICRFESLQLSFKNMCNLKAILENWLEEVEQGGVAKLEEVMRYRASGKRKRRVSIEKRAKSVLESHFLDNCKPTRDEIGKLADAIGLDKDVVRVWFCNRRQKEKRIKEKRVQDRCITASSETNIGIISQLISENLMNSDSKP